MVYKYASDEAQSHMILLLQSWPSSRGMESLLAVALAVRILETVLLPNCSSAQHTVMTKESILGHILPETKQLLKWFVLCNRLYFWRAFQVDHLTRITSSRMENAVEVFLEAMK
ncbi:unnamed protein product [Calypogeia fissa]